MKNRVIKLSAKFITDALVGKAVNIASNLPSNVELLDIRYDLVSNQMIAIIRSDSFQELADSQPPPEFKLTFSPVPRTQPQPPASLEMHTTVETSTQPPPTSNKIEEEFTPEQRELLSFKFEGDQVLIRPNQFLKAEWDDINETVRSLGGRWTKGDIISYWVVPI